MCQCGCNGWCTYYPLVRHLQWDMDAAATGIFAAQGPFGPFTAEQHKQQQQAGKPINACAACCELRSDWPAWAELGACCRQWGHKQSPCPCCNCPKRMLRQLGNISTVSVPWEIYTDIKYRTDLAMYEQVAYLSNVCFSYCFCFSYRF